MVVLSPWHLFLSWKIPDGVNPLHVQYCGITGSVVTSVYSKTVYNLLPISDGILPSSVYIITMAVVYVDGQVSDPISLKVTTVFCEELAPPNVHRGAY